MELMASKLKRFVNFTSKRERGMACAFAAFVMAWIVFHVLFGFPFGKWL